MTGPAIPLPAQPEVPPDFGLGPQAQADLAPVFGHALLSAHHGTRVYTARTALLLLLDLGLEPALRAGATAEALASGFAAQALPPLRWMLQYLAQEGLLAESEGGYRLEGAPDLDLEAVRRMVAEEAPGHEVNLDLLDGVRRNIPPFFTLGKPGDALLFDLRLYPLWLTYFRNENLVYLPNNLLPLLALREGLPEGARVLEVGGGAGGFAELVARDAAEKGYAGRIGEYRFTDVAPAFLRRAQRELQARTPGLPLSFSAFDLNRDPAEQGLEAGSFDAVVGVNVLHVAQDLPAALAALHRLLKPGGRLVIGECLKPRLDHAIHLEFLFKFLKGFTDVKLDPALRPVAGFLTADLWHANLDAAGFREVREVPDSRRMIRYYPQFYVGAFEGRV